MATFSKAVFYKRTYNIPVVVILFGLMDNLVNAARDLIQYIFSKLLQYLYLHYTGLIIWLIIYVIYKFSRMSKAF